MSWTHGYVILQALCATDNCCQGMFTRPCEFVSDTDSFLIGLDNHATCCMENDVNNFVTKLTPTPNIRVRGVGNQLMTANGRGTILWKIEDDNRVLHETLFTVTLYIPDLKLCLLSPQSWCQSADYHFPRRYGTWQYQTDDNFLMEWDQRKFHRTVHWDVETNTGRISEQACSSGRCRPVVVITRLRVKFACVCRVISPQRVSPQWPFPHTLRMGD
jgi:hypothetical protein